MRVANGAVGANYDRAPSSEDINWQLHGLCGFMDPEFFQPVTESQEREVKKVCRTCPVVMQCRQWALDKHEEAGVWGALTEKDRRAIWRTSYWRESHRRRPSA